MRQSGCTALVTAAVMALGISVERAENNAGAPGQGWQPARQDRVGDRWRQHHDQVRAAAPQGPARRGGDAARTAVANRRRRSHRTRHRQGAEVRLLQPPCRHLHDQHRARRQGLAVDLRQARKARPVGRALHKDLEIGRTPMSVGKTKAPVEQMTISIDDTPKGATLRIARDRRRCDGCTRGQCGSRQAPASDAGAPRPVHDRQAPARLDGLHVAIVGDVLHSRVARSLIQALPARGCARHARRAPTDAPAARPRAPRL